MLLALCGLPAAIQCINEKSSKGMNKTFLAMWFFGEVLTLAYVAQKSNVVPLLTNYLINIICLLVIIYYKVKDEFKKVA